MDQLNKTATLFKPQRVYVPTPLQRSQDKTASSRKCRLPKFQRLDGGGASPSTQSGINKTTQANSDALSYFTSQEAEHQLKMHIYERVTSTSNTTFKACNKMHSSFLNDASLITQGNNMLNSLKRLSRNNNVIHTFTKGPPSRVKGGKYEALLEDCFLTQAQISIPHFTGSLSRNRQLTTNQLLEKSAHIERECSLREEVLKDQYTKERELLQREGKDTKHLEYILGESGEQDYLFRSKKENQRLTQKALQQLELSQRKKWLFAKSKMAECNEPNKPSEIRAKSQTPSPIKVKQQHSEPPISRTTFAHATPIASKLFDLWLEDQSHLGSDSLPVSYVVKGLLRVGVIHSEKLAQDLLSYALGLGQKGASALLQNEEQYGVTKAQFMRLVQAGPRQDKIIEAIQRQLREDKRVKDNANRYKEMKEGSPVLKEIQDRVLIAEKFPLQGGSSPQLMRETGSLGLACAKELTSIINHKRYSQLKKILDYDVSDTLSQAKIVSFVKLCKSRHALYQQNPSAFKEHSSFHNIQDQSQRPTSALLITSQPPQILTNSHSRPTLQFVPVMEKQQSRSVTPSNLRKRHPDILIENAQLFDHYSSIHQQLQTPPTLGGVGTPLQRLLELNQKGQDSDEIEGNYRRGSDESKRKMDKIMKILKHDYEQVQRQGEYLDCLRRVKQFVEMVAKIDKVSSLKQTNQAMRELSLRIEEFEKSLKDLQTTFGRAYAFTMLGLTLEIENMSVTENTLCGKEEIVRLVRLLIDTQIGQQKEAALPNPDIMDYYSIVEGQWWIKELDPLKLQTVRRVDLENFLKNKGIIADHRELQRIMQIYLVAPKSTDCQQSSGLQEHVRKSEFLRIMCTAILRYALSSLPQPAVNDFATRVICFQRQLLVDGLAGQTSQVPETESKSVAAVTQMQKMESRKRNSQTQIRLAGEFSEYQKDVERKYTSVLEENQGPSSQTAIPLGQIQYRRPKIIRNAIMDDSADDRIRDVRELSAMIHGKLMFPKIEPFSCDPSTKESCIAPKLRAQLRANQMGNFQLRLMGRNGLQVAKSQESRARVGLAERQVLGMKMNEGIKTAGIKSGLKMTEIIEKLKQQRVELLTHKNQI